MEALYDTVIMEPAKCGIREAVSQQQEPVEEPQCQPPAWASGSCECKIKQQHKHGEHHHVGTSHGRTAGHAAVEPHRETRPLPVEQDRYEHDRRRIEQLEYCKRAFSYADIVFLVGKIVIGERREKRASHPRAAA